MRNKKAIVIMLSLICILIAIGTTTAYYVIEGTARNEITASNVKIRLNITDEKGKDAKDTSLDVMPGRDITRNLTVTNIGNEPCWVRVQPSISIDDNLMGIASGGYAAIDPRIRINEENTSDWIYRDGFYYFTKILQPTESTSPLFGVITFDASIDNIYANSKVRLEAEAYGTQSKHNGKEVLDAKGWPKSRELRVNIEIDREIQPDNENRN